MIFYPAIDIKDGHCVRVRQGDLAEADVYHRNPPDQAAFFEDQGATWLHVVDLEGAVEGIPHQARLMREIVRRTKLSVQVGGGIRTLRDVQEWFDAGAARVVVGTMALNDPDVFDRVVNRWPGKIVVALDSRDGRVATHGWKTQSTVLTVDVAAAFGALPLAAIIFTDIRRDGMGMGVNRQATAALADVATVPVIASGGLSSEADLQALVDMQHPNIDGVICGRAIYEGHVNVARCLKITGQI
ncbi:MAG: 1-(5-phosphoribosyl)-5-[(5-phosphoribosylamino)methylideneamino]imidazole-4-carboxamide isomerase [Alphaproteobacteria bacterium]